MRVVRFIISSIIFIILIKIAPILSLFFTKKFEDVPFKEMGDNLLTLFDNLTGNTNNITEIGHATLWMAIIYFIVIPFIKYPLSVILPVASTYKDTSQLRSLRYLSLVILLFLVPYGLLILVGVYHDFTTGGTISTAIAVYHPIYLLSILTLTGSETVAIIVWVSISISCHYFLIKSSPLIASIIDFIDAGKRGLGGSSRFGNMVEEMADYWKGTTKSLFMGNSLFIPWMKIGAEDERHMLTIAGTRSGKGASVIIPNLLSYKGSIVCIDPKGENYAVTAKRRREFGEVYPLDPFNVFRPLGENEGFNPLAHLKIESLSIVEDIGVITEALIKDEAHTKNAHFTASARALVSGYIAQVISDPEYFPNPSLVDVYDIITAPIPERDKIHARMMQNEQVGKLAKNAAIRVLAGIKSNEFKSVEATAVEQLRWISTLSMRNFLTGNSICFSKMRECTTSFYVIIPPEYMEYHSRFLRLIINVAFNQFRKGGKSPTPALFIIDEAHSLGHMKQIETAYGLNAGFNMVVWTFFQDISQLNQLYGQAANSFIANSRAIQVFSLKDKETKLFVSEQLGKRNLSGALALLRKAEIAPLRESVEIEREVSKDSGQSYLLRAGKPPFLLRRVNYFQSLYWSRWANYNPAYKTKKDEFIEQIEMKLYKFYLDIQYPTEQPFHILNFIFISVPKFILDAIMIILQISFAMLVFAILKYLIFDM